MILDHFLRKFLLSEYSHRFFLNGAACLLNRRCCTTITPYIEPLYRTLSYRTVQISGAQPYSCVQHVFLKCCALLECFLRVLGIKPIVQSCKYEFWVILFFSPVKTLEVTKAWSQNDETETTLAATLFATPCTLLKYFISIVYSLLSSPGPGFHCVIYHYFLNPFFECFLCFLKSNKQLF